MRNSVLTLAIVALFSAIIFSLIGFKIGHDSGYKTAYTLEHSHYLFEQKRARGFENRILSQRRCIDKMVSAIPPVEDTGLAALGETFRAFGLLYWGTARCNRESNFGFASQAQMHHIMPNQN